MEVKIGITHVARELSIDTDLDPDAVEAAVRAALAEDDGMLTLTDPRGRRLVVPANRIGYVDVSSSATGQVGFRS